MGQTEQTGTYDPKTGKFTWDEPAQTGIYDPKTNKFVLDKEPISTGKTGTFNPNTGTFVPDKEISVGEAAGKGFLSEALAFGDYLADLLPGMPGQYSHQTAEATGRQATAYADEAAKQRPVATGVGSFAADVIAAAPGFVMSYAALPAATPLALSGTATGIGMGITSAGGPKQATLYRQLNLHGDREIAEKAANVTQAAHITGFALPGGIGRTLLGKVGTGAVAGVGLGEAEVYGHNQLLAEKYPHLVQELGDPTRMAINAVLGSVTGALGGAHPRSFTRAGIQEERMATKFQDALREGFARAEKEGGGSSVLPEGFGKDKASQAHSFVSKDVASLQKEVAALEEQQKTVNLTGTKDEQLIMQAAIDSRKQALTVAESNKVALEAALGMPKTKAGVETGPQAVVEYAQKGPVYQEHPKAVMDAEIARLDDEIKYIDKQLKDPNLSPEQKKIFGDRHAGLTDAYHNLVTRDGDASTDTIAKKLKMPGLWTKLAGTKNVWIENSLNTAVNGVKARTKISNVIEGFVSKLGLGDHKLVIGENLFRTNQTQGSTRIIGDTTYISLNREQILDRFKELIDTNPVMKTFYKKLNPADQISFRYSVVVAHELGHAFWYRAAHSYFKDPASLDVLGKRYIDWVRKQESEGKVDYRETSKVLPEHFLFDDTFVKGPLSFKEYLAQSVARKLVLEGNVFYREAPSGVKLADFYSTSPIGKFISEFRSFMKNLLDSYKLSKINVIGNKSSAEVDGVVSRFIDNIIKENEISSALGETIFTKYQNKYVSSGTVKSLQDTADTLRNLSTWGKSADDMPALKNQSSVPKSAFEATEALKARGKDIGPLTAKFLFNMFGKMQTASRWGIFEDNPVLSYVYTSIRDAQQHAVKEANYMWYGAATQVKQKGLKILQNLKVVESGDSPSILVNRASARDMFEIHRVFEIGFKQELDYADSLARYGTGFTPDQRKLFESLAAMFKRQWESATRTQVDLGKKHVLPYRKGWYPSVRMGDWSVELKMGGVGVHRQHFRTEDEANIFVRKFSSLKDKQGLTISTPLKKEKSDAWDSAMGLVDIIQRQLDLQGMSRARQEVEALVDRLITKGGKLGKHHQQRSNLSGYRGSELFKSEEELGDSFRSALHSSVDEYASVMKKMMISQKLTGITNVDPETRAQFKGTFDAVDILANTALNKNQVLTEGLDETVRKYSDKLAARAGQALGKADYYPKMSAFDRTHGVLTNLFYIFSLTLRPSFWLGNVMSSPNALRLMLRETNTFSAMASAGAGTQRLMHPDDVFTDAVFSVAQYTNTFHPQFMNDLTQMPLVSRNSSELLKKTTEIFTGQTIASMSDSFSRYWTFSMFFEHYRKHGLTGEALWKRAAEATDNTLVQYGRAEKAPIFEKLGILGETISPLQTYSQAQLGNLVSDFRFMLKNKNAAPLVSTFLMTGLMAGAVGIPLLVEYELIRMLLEKADLLEEDEFSLMKLLLSGDDRTISHGMFAATGYDVGSSMRWNPIAKAIVSSESSFIDMFPAVSWSTKMVGATSTKLKHAFGGDVSEADLRAADMQLTPSGVYKGALDYFRYGDREFVPSQGKGYATVPQTPERYIATALGTRTVEDARNKSIDKIIKGKKEQRAAGINETNELLIEAVMNKDKNSVNRYIKVLSTEYGVDPKTIFNTIQEGIYKRSVSEEERRYGKTGVNTANKYWQYKQYQDFENGEQ